MAKPNDASVERPPFSNLPYVYFKPSLDVFRSIRKVHKPEVFVDIDTLRNATGVDKDGPMPAATFSEYAFALRQLGFFVGRRGANGKDEDAGTILGDRLVRTPEVDTASLMGQWKTVLDPLSCRSLSANSIS